PRTARSGKAIHTRTAPHLDARCGHAARLSFRPWLREGRSREGCGAWTREPRDLQARRSACPSPCGSLHEYRECKPEAQEVQGSTRIVSNGLAAPRAESLQ